jgi:hypothetical protein
LHKLSTRCNAKSSVQTKSTSDVSFESRIGLPVIVDSCSIPRASLSEWLRRSANASRKMLRSTLIVTLCFSMAPTLLVQSPPALNLIPVPARVQPGTGRLAVNQTFAIGIDGPNDDLRRRAEIHNRSGSSNRYPHVLPPVRSGEGRTRDSFRPRQQGGKSAIRNYCPQSPPAWLLLTPQIPMGAMGWMRCQSHAARSFAGDRFHQMTRVVDVAAVD